jgi:VCBS repeat-containing protein
MDCNGGFLRIRFALKHGQEIHPSNSVESHDGRALLISILGFDDAAMMQGLKQFN